jgi:hypothetical protein
MLSNFPTDLKLSYDNSSHKKVYNSDILIAIPDGAKCFAWFTIVDDEETCLIIDQATMSWRKFACCFDKQLARNQTILHGVVFTHLNASFFSCEDVLFYKGRDVSKKTWLDKLDLFATIFKEDIKQISYNSKFIVFAMPLMAADFNTLISQIYKVNYKISAIQFKKFQNVGHYTSSPFYYKAGSNHPCAKGLHQNRVVVKEKETQYVRQENRQHNAHEDTRKNVVHPYPPIVKAKEKEKEKEVVFKVKADVQTDVYHLYGKDDALFDTCCIPTYTTSVMMNGIFRTIKENNNLDALEESDDEDEFENDKIDKYVDLNKSCNFVCVYNMKFKKWTPIRVSDVSVPVVDTKSLRHRSS